MKRIKKKVVERYPLWLVLIFAVLFVIGINLGEDSFVWEKGTRICLSCIGIG